MASARARPHGEEPASRTPHGEEPAKPASRTMAGSAGPSFETRPAGAPQDEACETRHANAPRDEADRVTHRHARENYRWDGVEMRPYKEDERALYKAITRQVLFSDPAMAGELRYFEVAPG